MRLAMLDPRAVASLIGHQVVVLVETPLGAERVRDLVQVANVVGAMWGADDLVAGLGGVSSAGARTERTGT